MMLSTRLTLIAFLAAAWCWTSEGQLYDVACPGVNGELMCPKNQVIEVLAVQTGVRHPNECKNRKVPDPKATSTYLHRGMFPWIKFLCNDLQRCRLPKPNVKMFSSKTRQSFRNNYLHVTYNCKPKQSGTLNVVACEGKTAELKCDSGVISIVKASFGRLDENICTKTPSYMTFCASHGAARAVMKKCRNQKSCEIKAVASQLGKPGHCDTNPKYLTVDYVCQ